LSFLQLVGANFYASRYSMVRLHEVFTEERTASKVCGPHVLGFVNKW